MADLADRILACLEEKPRSISEIARELDEEKYQVSKKIEVLDEQGAINTHKIGRSTACILTEEDPHDDEAVETDEPGSERSDAIEEETGVLDEAFSSSTADKQEAERITPLEEDGVDPRPADPLEEPIPQDDMERASTADAADPGPEPGAGGPRTIGVVSGKGGVGKTVVTLNLGAAMRDLGEKVIVLDSDAEMPNVGLQLGITTYPTPLSEVVEQDVHIMSAMHVDTDSGLRVIPTSLRAESVQEDVEEAINMIPDEYTVLIDSPPGYERPLGRVIETCDELLFVTTPEIPSVTDTYKLYQEAKERGKEAVGVVINMHGSHDYHLSKKEVEAALELPVLGVIDHSKVIPSSIFENQPAVTYKPYAKPSRSFKRIASDMTGRHYEESLLDRVRGWLP